MALLERVVSLLGTGGGGQLLLDNKDASSKILEFLPSKDRNRVGAVSKALNGLAAARLEELANSQLYKDLMGWFDSVAESDTLIIEESREMWSWYALQYADYLNASEYFTLLPSIRGYRVNKSADGVEDGSVTYMERLVRIMAGDNDCDVKKTVSRPKRADIENPERMEKLYALHIWFARGKSHSGVVIRRVAYLEPSFEYSDDERGDVKVGKVEGFLIHRCKTLEEAKAKTLREFREFMKMS
jgi:hypothetical protein